MLPFLFESKKHEGKKKYQVEPFCPSQPANTDTSGAAPPKQQQFKNIRENQGNKMFASQQPTGKKKWLPSLKNTGSSFASHKHRNESNHILPELLQPSRI